MKQKIWLAAITATIMTLSGCTQPVSGGSTGEPVIESPSQMASSALSSNANDSISEYVLLRDGPAPSQVVTVEGDSNIPDAGVVSVKVLVQGSKVAAYVCATQDAGIVAQNCDGAFDTFSIDDAKSEMVWTGTQDGSTAIVSGSDRFYWGTVIFGGDGTNPAVTSFVVASGCVDVDGNQGVHDEDHSGLCELR